MCEVLFVCKMESSKKEACLSIAPKVSLKETTKSLESLEDFLDSSGEKTIEGYPAPKRAYLKARKAQDSALVGIWNPINARCCCEAADKPLRSQLQTSDNRLVIALDSL